MANLLLIEDDQDVREELGEYLKRDHQLHAADSLKAFTTFLSQHPVPDVAIIDLGLPDGDGTEAVKAIRHLSERTGIILLTARSRLTNRLQGLGLGADHYLVKPISLLELGAIIDALLRRIGLEWEYHSHLKQLRSPDGKVLELNRLESALFDLLAESRGDTVSRESLVKHLGHQWRDFDLRRIDTGISRLRTRWQKTTLTPLPLKTRHGVGYSFNHSIRSV